MGTHYHADANYLLPNKEGGRIVLRVRPTTSVPGGSDARGGKGRGINAVVPCVKTNKLSQTVYLPNIKGGEAVLALQSQAIGVGRWQEVTDCHFYGL